MQLVVMPLSPRSLGAGHLVSELPLGGRPLTVLLHTVEPSCGVAWAGQERPPVLLMLEGIGKVSIDGASQRLAGPCALCPPPHAELSITNLGAVRVHLLEVSLA